MYVIVCTLANGDRLAMVDNDGTPFESRTTASEWAEVGRENFGWRDIEILDADSVN